MKGLTAAATRDFGCDGIEVAVANCHEDPVSLPPIARSSYRPTYSILPGAMRTAEHTMIDCKLPEWLLNRRTLIVSMMSDTAGTSVGAEQLALTVEALCCAMAVPDHSSFSGAVPLVAYH